MDPLRELKERFEQELAEGLKAVHEHRANDARGAAKAALAQARPLGPKEEQRAWVLGVRVATDQKDEQGLLKAVRGWLIACGPTGTDSCRRTAISALLSPAFQGGAHARLAAQAQLATNTDACLQRAEAVARPTPKPPACLNAALASYRRTRDRLMIARALHARALAGRAGSPRVLLEKLKAVSRGCPEERCKALRARVLKEALPLFDQLQDAKGGATFALEQLKLETDRSPQDERRYARTREVEAACERLDSRDGGGACHRLEKALMGSYVFWDFSKEQVPGEGLPSEVVQRVSRQYEVLVNDCLKAEPRREHAAEDVTRYGLHWTVLNDGHVAELRMERKDLESSPLAQCLREAFTTWRYPRYGGQLQHVDQEFTLRIPGASAARL
jgi:hypothetical protein